MICSKQFWWWMDERGYHSAFGPAAYECPFLMSFTLCFLKAIFKNCWQHLILPPRIFWLLDYVSASQNFDTERMGVFTLIQISISPRCGIWSGARWVITKIYWFLPVTRDLNEQFELRGSKVSPGVAFIISLLLTSFRPHCLLCRTHVVHFVSMLKEEEK